VVEDGGAGVSLTVRACAGVELCRGGCQRSPGIVSRRMAAAADGEAEVGVSV
jgi:hypothetical protein